MTDPLLLAAGQETFIVSTQDKIISRAVYETREFDLDKFFTARRLLGVQTNALTLLDIGANIGTICIPLVARGEVAAAIAIEPEPQNFKLLKANIVLNEVEDQITAMNVALASDPTENLTFELSADNFGDHRVHQSRSDGAFGEEERKVVSVAAKTLDEVMATQPSSETFIWMDTQGYEGHILAGAPKTLRDAPPMVIEFWPYGMKRCESFAPLKTALQQSSYTHFWDLGTPDSPAQRLNDTVLDSLYNRLGEAWPFTDLLLTRQQS